MLLTFFVAECSRARGGPCAVLALIVARGAQRKLFCVPAWPFMERLVRVLLARRSAGALTPLASPSPLANGPKGLTVAEQAPEISPGAERCTLRAPLAGSP